MEAGGGGGRAWLKATGTTQANSSVWVHMHDIRNLNTDCEDVRVQSNVTSHVTTCCDAPTTKASHSHSPRRRCAGHSLRVQPSAPCQPPTLPRTRHSTIRRHCPFAPHRGPEHMRDGVQMGGGGAHNARLAAPLVRSACALSSLRSPSLRFLYHGFMARPGMIQLSDGL